jgi:hypothetical protein
MVASMDRTNAMAKFVLAFRLKGIVKENGLQIDLYRSQASFRSPNGKARFGMAMRARDLDSSFAHHAMKKRGN